MKKVLTGFLIGIVFSTSVFIIYLKFINTQKILDNNVLVTISKKTTKHLKYINLKSENTSHNIKINNHSKEFQFVFPSFGENSFKINVEFEDGKILSSEYYVESGYDIYLEITNNRITNITSF